MPTDAPFTIVLENGGMEYSASYSAFISAVGTAEYLSPISASRRKMHKPLNPDRMGTYGRRAGFSRNWRLKNSVLLCTAVRM